MLNPVTPAERRYNAAHIKSRNTIERTFGLWKSRFHCLQNTLRFCPRRCANVIVARAILHNFANHEGEPEVDEQIANDNPQEINLNILQNAQGNLLRRNITAQYFN